MPPAPPSERRRAGVLPEQQPSRGDGDGRLRLRHAAPLRLPRQIEPTMPPPSTGRSCLSSLHAPCRSFTREQQPPRDDGDDRLRCVMLSLDADHRGRNSMICSWTASAAANHGRGYHPYKIRI
uniref:Uncharacterized protein n=1 Tax=Oryza rufipogon TaxID=4529 RepID=A0A0E0Q3W2_ORYRU